MGGKGWKKGEREEGRLGGELGDLGGKGGLKGFIA